MIFYVSAFAPEYAYSALLAGPYASREEATEHLEKVRALATHAVPPSWTFTTSSAAREIKTPFGKVTT